MEISLTATKGQGDNKPGNTASSERKVFLIFLINKVLASGYTDALEITVDIGGSETLKF